MHEHTIQGGLKIDGIRIRTSEEGYEAVLGVLKILIIIVFMLVYCFKYSFNELFVSNKD